MSIKTAFKQWLCVAALFTGMGAAHGADLKLQYKQPAQAAIDWNGMDDQGGDGSLTFTALGQSEAATLSVLCNSINGYRITFHSPNATSRNQSSMINGAASVGYAVKMDTSGIQNANIVTDQLVLNDPSTDSVNVNFVGGQLPIDGANPARVNRIVLNIQLQDFDGELRPVGTYTDVIRATIVMN